MLNKNSTIGFRIRLIITGLSFSLVPAWLLNSFSTLSGKKFSLPLGPLALFGLMSAGLWLFLRLVQDFSPGLWKRIVTFGIWGFLAGQAGLTIVDDCKPITIKFLPSIAEDSADFSRTDAPRLSGLRLKLGDETRPCIALLPNHSIGHSFNVPPGASLVYGIGVDRPDELSGKFDLEVMLRQGSGPVKKISQIEFYDSVIGWTDHTIDISKDYAGKKVDVIFQVRGLEERKDNDGAEPERFEIKRKEMENFFANLPAKITPGKEVKLPPNMADMLKALGYIQLARGNHI